MFPSPITSEESVMNIDNLNAMLDVYKMQHDQQSDGTIVVKYRGHKIIIRPKNNKNQISGLKLEVRGIAYVYNQKYNEVVKDINSVNANHDAKLWVDPYGMVSLCGQVTYSSDACIVANLPHDIVDVINTSTEFREKRGLPRLG